MTGAELCTIPRSLAGNDDVHEQVRAAVVVGTTRTMHQDVSYGLRQLTDVALRALSPSVNDPATAQEAVYHAAAVLDELLHRDPPAQVRSGPRGTWLVLSGRPSHAELVALAFDEVRRAAAAQPGVCVDVLEALHVLHRSMAWDGLADRCPALEAQAHLLLAGAEAADLLPADLQAVRRAHAGRFGAESRWGRAGRSVVRMRVGEFVTELNSHAGAFLFGRRTFDIFRGHWPDQTDPDNPVASAINSLPK